MIKNSTPLTLAEVMELSRDGEKAQQVKNFIKKFTKMKVEEAREIKQDLKNLEILKLKDDHLVKIIDFLPIDASDILKIIPDVSLDQDEVNKILNVIKKH